MGEGDGLIPTGARHRHTDFPVWLQGYFPSILSDLTLHMYMVVMVSFFRAHFQAFDLKFKAWNIGMIFLLRSGR